MRGKALELHAALARGTPEDLAAARLLWHELRNGTILTILFALALIVLGRFKPRLGQNYARAFSREPATREPGRLANPATGMKERDVHA